MNARWLGWLAPMLLTMACEIDSVTERLSLELAEGEVVQRVDLNPSSVDENIDNTITVHVALAAEENDTSPVPSSVIFSLYRIDYRLGDEEAPYIAGEISVQLADGASDTLVLPAAADPQLTWIGERYAGEALTVQARVHLAGVYDDKEAVLITSEYQAVFADYE